jgi:hypothetical protein
VLSGSRANRLETQPRAHEPELESR